MSEAPDDRELLDDLELLCDGRIDADRFVRLQDRLRGNPRAQRVYLDFLDTHLALGRLLRPAPADETPTPAPPRSDPGSSRFRPARRAAFGAAAAALVALTLGLLAFRGRTGREAPEPAGAPVLAQASGARLFGREAPAGGSRLRFGEEYALTHGLMEVAFADGASAIIRAPAVFVVAGRSRLVMKLGRCSVHAPDGAEGFRVETPLAEVVDLGTRFSVDVSDSGGTDVQVLEGVAEVYPGAPPGSRDGPTRLETGQARRYQLKQDVAAESLAFDPSRYTRQLPDRVVSYDATERESGGVEDLLGVAVQRGGALRRYGAKDLIGVDVVHYHGGGGQRNITTVTGEVDPAIRDRNDRGRASLLDGDANLNTGLINPGGSRDPLTRDPVFHNPEDPLVPNTPGLAVRFRKPVVNSAGPDVVFFELQVIVHPERGDPFRVSPLRFSPGLKTHSVWAYDIDLASPEAKTLAGFRLYTFASPPRSLEDALAGKHNRGSEFAVRAKALAVGIDLSDLGYKEGDLAEGLFFQDAQDDENLFDPVFIAGLPPARPGAVSTAP